MEDFYRKIESYLLGELNETELAAFENALQTDAELAKSVVQHQTMIQRLEGLRLRNKVKSAAEQPMKSLKVGNTNRIYWAIGASIIVLGFGFWYFNRPLVAPSESIENQFPVEHKEPVQSPIAKVPDTKPEQPKAKTGEKPNLIALAREFQVMPAEGMVRDATPSAPKTPKEQATAAFFNQNYRLAAQLLQDDQTLGQDEETRFIRGSARLNAGQFEGAAADFDALKGSFQFKHEARWNFLLCKFALGKTKEAQILLKTLSEDEDFPFRQKALGLRKRLNF